MMYRTRRDDLYHKYKQADSESLVYRQAQVLLKLFYQLFYRRADFRRVCTQSFFLGN
jgi:hypothetical protein